LQDGRTFRRRRVTAIQQGEPILCLESSFTTDSSRASDYQSAPPAPSPDKCPALEPPRRVEGGYSPWDLLEVRTTAPGADLPRRTAGDIWFRFRAGPLPGTRSEVLITYLSDLTLAATMLRPTREHPAGRRDVVGLTSLDHSVWFHNEPDLSGWLLYAKDTPAVGGLRGLVGGAIFGQDGTLVASVAQEALVHVAKD
jgi:acyl-CoA thioesterase-2